MLFVYSDTRFCLLLLSGEKAVILLFCSPYSKEHLPESW